MFTVHLLRHGEVFNPDRVLYGRLPGYHLSELGRRQAAAAADWLTRYDVTYLVSSPMERAQETAGAVADTTQLPVALDERLIEAASAFEGYCVTDRRDVVSLLGERQNWKYFANPLKPSWGESYRAIARRMRAAILDARDAALAVDPAARHAVAVSHQLPIVVEQRVVQGRVLSHDPRRRRCALASVTSLTLDGDVVVGFDYHEPAAVLPTGQGTGA